MFLFLFLRPPLIWRVLNKLRCERLPNNEALQWAVLSTQSLLQVVLCRIAVSVNFKHDIRGSEFTWIIELVLLEVRVTFPSQRKST